MKKRNLSAGFAVGIAAVALGSSWTRESHAGPVEMANGDIVIDGQRVACKSDVRAILDVKLPNLGIATRRLLVLNPQLLSRFSPTVRMFVYHHECGHHHVGGDELAADCWAVKTGVNAGWLKEPKLREICSSFGNVKATATHPAAVSRCKALTACYTAAVNERSKPTAPTTNVADAPAPAPRLSHEGFTAPASAFVER